MILAGDFNSSESGEAYQQVIADGYIDSYRVAHPDPTALEFSGYTWDKSHNTQNIEFGHEFELPMDNFGRPEMKDLFNVFNDRKRRIDFLFFKDLKSGTEVLSSKVVEISSKQKDEVLFGSDHLGVLTELGLRKKIGTS